MDEQTIFFVEAQGERRAVDPFRVERLLAQGLGGQKLSEVIAAARTPSTSVSGPAQEKLLAAAYLAFGLTPLQPDGSGCTERTPMRILAEYLRWREEARRKNAPAPTSSPATESASSPSPLTSSSASR